MSTIQRAEVIEVYNDLSLLTSDKIGQLLRLEGAQPEPDQYPPLVTDELIVRVMPRDSARVRVIGDDFSIICYPFFPSHMRLPLKVGEEVWVLFTDLTNQSDMLFDVEKASSRSNIGSIVTEKYSPKSISTRNSIQGYWMCRPTQARNIEDINYTPFGRARDKSAFEMRSAQEESDNARRSSSTPGFPAFVETDEHPTIVAKEDERLIKRIEDFADHFTFEPVARFTKLPGDAVIAGSHDSRIVLGSLRQSEPSPAGVDAGAIDLVAGTGKSSGNSPITVTNSLGLAEVNKDPLFTGKSDPPREGDPDMMSDSARLLIAESAPLDQMFSVTPDTVGPVDVSEKSGPAVVARAQHIRILSSDGGSIRLIVEGPTQSSIVIDSSGNIEVTSGSEVSVQAPKIFLGTTSETRSKTGVIVGDGGILTILAALRNDLLGAPSASILPNPAGVAALPFTASALASLGVTLEADPLLASLASKTVFASS